MKPLLARVDAVLFDLDGTLVETNIDFARMWREMVDLAVEAGLPRAEVTHLDILAIVDRAAEHLTEHQRHNDAEALRARAMFILEEMELERAGAATEIPFAKQLLLELSQRGIGVGIVTRNCRKASLISLGAVGIDHTVLICREDTERRKPHPDPIHAALSALDARPEASIMVGDHLMDVQSGKAAGLKTIAFLRDHRPDDFFEAVAPDVTVRSLREVLCAIVDCHR
jgi:phosphoglycolate phosphatase